MFSGAEHHSIESKVILVKSYSFIGGENLMREADDKALKCINNIKHANAKTIVPEQSCVVNYMRYWNSRKKKIQN